MSRLISIPGLILPPRPRLIAPPPSFDPCAYDRHCRRRRERDDPRLWRQAASPAFRSVASSTGTGTSFTQTAPTGFVDNDVALWGILTEDTISGFTINGAWTNLFTTDVGPFTYRIYWLRRSGAPNLGISWTTSRYWESVIIASSGCVTTGTAIDASAVGTPANVQDVDPPAVTLVTADTLVYAFATNWAGYGTTAAPTGYTNRFSPGTSFDQVIASKAVAATGSENPDAFGSAIVSDFGCGFTVALRSQAPAAASNNSLFFGAFP